VALAGRPRPYLRHRWVIPSTRDRPRRCRPLAASERCRVTPEEVQAIYSTATKCPRDFRWSLFGLAQREIGILGENGLFSPRTPHAI
jgi:hypothetical protein